MSIKITGDEKRDTLKPISAPTTGEETTESEARFSDRLFSAMSAFGSRVKFLKDVIFGTAKIRFEGLNSAFEIYREPGDSGKLVIDSVTDGEDSIRIGETNQPLDVYIYGTDEGLIGAKSATTSYLLMEPGRAGIFTDKGNDFYFKLPAGTANPSATTTGALAVVNGKLMIYNGSGWVVVGDQTA